MQLNAQCPACGLPLRQIGDRCPGCAGSRHPGIPAVAAAALLGLVATSCVSKADDTGGEEAETTSYSSEAIYGTPGTSRYDDLDGDGWSPIDGDCDDEDETVHPGATETPGDGIDSNCDGEDDT